jgi:hypothetical protein
MDIRNFVYFINKKGKITNTLLFDAFKQKCTVFHDKWCFEGGRLVKAIPRQDKIFREAGNFRHNNHMIPFRVPTAYYHSTVM